MQNFSSIWVRLINIQNDGQKLILHCPIGYSTFVMSCLFVYASCCPFLIEAHWFWLLCVGLCCALSSTYKAHCMYLSACVCMSAYLCVYGFGSLHRQHWRVLLNLKITPAPQATLLGPQSYKHCHRKAKYHSNLWWYFIMHCTIWEERYDMIHTHTQSIFEILAICWLCLSFVKRVQPDF